MDSKKVFLLKQELNAFLQLHPQYKEMQKEIDELLLNAGSSHNRMVILEQLMKKKVQELSLKMEELSTKLRSFKELL